MTFESVLKDLVAQAVEEANQTFLAARSGHDVKPFTSERSVVSDGGHVFTVKIHFTPNELAADWWNVVQN